MAMEWLDWSVKVIVPLISGVVGVSIGAQLTTWRERWNLRRELYFELLRELVELDFRLRDMRNTKSQLQRVVADNLVAQKYRAHLHERFGPQFDLVSEALLRVSRALAVARIIIPPRIARTLDEMGSAGLVAIEQDAAGLDPIGERMQQHLSSAISDLQTEARADLLGRSGWVPAESLLRGQKGTS